jgi:hypothetical protein
MPALHSWKTNNNINLTTHMGISLNFGFLCYKLGLVVMVYWQAAHIPRYSPTTPTHPETTFHTPGLDIRNLLRNHPYTRPSPRWQVPCKTCHVSREILLWQKLDDTWTSRQQAGRPPEEYSENLGARRSAPTRDHTASSRLDHMRIQLLRDHSVDSRAFLDSLSASTLTLPGMWAVLIQTFCLAEHQAQISAAISLHLLDLIPPPPPIALMYTTVVVLSDRMRMCLFKTSLHKDWSPSNTAFNSR